MFATEAQRSLPTIAVLFWFCLFFCGFCKVCVVWEAVLAVKCAFWYGFVWSDKEEVSVKGQESWWMIQIVFSHTLCSLLDVPRCRCYDQHCVVRQNAPLPHLHPPLVLPPLSHPACRPFWSPPPARTQPVIQNPNDTSWRHAHRHSHQLLWSHVVQDSLCSLAVMATLHNCKKELRGIILQKNPQRNNLVIKLPFWIYNWVHVWCKPTVWTCTEVGKEHSYYIVK